MNPAERILRVLAGHLTGPAELRLLGGAALILGYGRNRGTEDVDLVHDDAELQALIDAADLGAALERTNNDLADEGLYITHIWDPSQQILTPGWRSSCRRLDGCLADTGLRVSTLGPLDLITSKLCRADDEDLADVAWLIEHERLSRDDLERALDAAVVPPEFAEVFPGHAARVLELYDDLDSPERP